MKLVKLSHASKASRQKIMAKPTRVAIEDWQLHDLKKADAAVLVQKKARPARHEFAMEARPPPRKGSESATPMMSSQVEERRSVSLSGATGRCV